MIKRPRYFPVRVLVPLVLLTLAVISSLLFSWKATTENQKRVLVDGQSELRALVTTLQGILNQNLANADLKSANEILEFSALSPNIKTIFITDNNFSVIVSGKIGVKGEQSRWVSDFDNETAHRVMQTGIGDISEHPSQQVLRGYYPLDLPLAKHQLRKSQKGLLFVEYDLASKIDEMNQVLWGDIRLQFIRSFTLVIIVAWILDWRISRRLKRVERAAQQLASGDLHTVIGMVPNDEVGVLACTFDNMARTLADRHRKLEQSEKQLLDAQAIAHIGNWHLDVASGQFTWSPEIYRIFQMNAGAPIPLFERMDYLFTVESWAEIQIRHQNIISDGIPVEFEVECLTAFREQRHIIVRARIGEKDSQGKPISILGTFQDVSERKRHEASLHQSEKRYSELFSALQEGILSLDKDGYIGFLNQQMANMLGYTDLDMLGCHIFQFMDQRDAMLFNNFLERRRQGINETHEFEFFSKSGERVVVIMASTALYDEKGHYSGTISGVVDITHRKLLEEELSDLNADLEMKLAFNTQADS